MSVQGVVEVLPRKKQVFLLVVLMSFSSVSLFTIFPYLSIYLKEQYSLTNSQAGLLVGSIALISSCGAWVGGMLVDRIGWLYMLRISSVLYVLVFLGLIVTEKFSLAVVLIFLIGLCRLLMEPALKTALAIYDDGSGRLFKFRYMAMVGAAIAGPLLSATLAPFGQQASFMIAVVFFATNCVLTIYLQEEKCHESHGQTMPLYVDWVSVGILVAIGFVFFSVFSQFESTLSLRLASGFNENGKSIYRTALLINAVLAIPVMHLADKLMAKLAMKFQVSVGVLAMGLSIWLLFGAPPVDLYVYIGAAFFTLGEVILFPLPDIAAAKIATAVNRGKLMGLIDIRYLGFFAGPAIGGVLLDHSEKSLAVALCLLTLILLPAYIFYESRTK